MSPYELMRVAQMLYRFGYISYPRTETTQYPENYDYLETLRQLSDSKWGYFVRKILKVGGVGGI